MFNDYAEYEKKVEAIQFANKALLEEFSEYLTRKGLTPKTINIHINNVEFYINEYLCYEDALEAKDGFGELGMYFGDFFVRKASWSSCAQLKSNAASIKKFYAFMLEKGEITKDKYDRLIDSIKDRMEDWLSNMQLYIDDPDAYYDDIYL